MEQLVIEREPDVDRSTGQVEVALALALQPVEGGNEMKALARIYVYKDRSIYVGFIETEPAWRQQGVATRLLLHAIDELGAPVVRAGTISQEAERLFDRLKDLRPDVTFHID